MQGILAIGQHGTYVSRGATAIERSDAKANGQTLALVTDVAFASGLAAAGFTAYWYLVKYKPAQQKRMEQQPAAPGSSPPTSAGSKRASPFMSAVHTARPARQAAASSGMRASTMDWVRKCGRSSLGTRYPATGASASREIGRAHV